MDKGPKIGRKYKPQFFMNKRLFNKLLKLISFLFAIPVFLVFFINCTGVSPKVCTSPKTMPSYVHQLHTIQNMAILGLVLGARSDFAGHVTLRTSSFISEELNQGRGIRSILPTHIEIEPFGAVLPGHFSDLKFIPGHHVGDMIANPELKLAQLCKFLNVDSVLSYVIYYEGIDLGEPLSEFKNMLKLAGNTAYGISISAAMGIFVPTNGKIVACEAEDQVSNVRFIEGKIIKKDRIHWVEEEPASSMFSTVFRGIYDVLWPLTPEEISKQSAHLSALLIKKLLSEFKDLNCIEWSIPPELNAGVLPH